MRFIVACGSFIFTAGVLAACADENNLDVKMPVLEPDASTAPQGTCVGVQSAQPIPARAATLSDSPAITTRTVYVDDLFNTMATHCGGCHVDVGLGGVQTSRASFSDVVNQDWVDSMRLNIPNTVMPPPSVGGKLYKDRPADDPVNELATLMQAWVDQGRPRDSFQLDVDSTAASGPFRVSKDIADTLTNIGNCLPDSTLYASEKQKMAEMDAKFASMTFLPPGKGTLAERIGLPVHLDETDLTTLDSSELAKFGVVAYSLNYPVWVDPANRALRHVRVPLGESVIFDKTSQTFTIPGGTRFYKTSLQRVIDVDGSTRWRKLETQLAVVWPNIENMVGSGAVTSLFGTYAWNDDESQATLVTDPTRNGEPFRDRVVTYISDEPTAAVTLAAAAAGSNTALALRKAHALRSYAIPGSRRCMQCHMGSVNKDFVIGFQPLQIVRRNQGEGGIIDSVGSDELDQLNRFISYKLITGISSADDVTPLEKSQGSRTARNDYELKAQAYVLANCAHCHNPIGEPSVDNPSLQTLLNFQPSATGGIFQFPLESYSPRITRGSGAGMPVPYITPSLTDIDHPTVEPQHGDAFWKPKCSVRSMTCMYAPWRSLIYRGVDTPFTYSDDVALFPHMPESTQSIDCNATRILGDWMVSIPGVLKDPNVLEYAIRTVTGDSPLYDASPQPYREVKPGQTGYKAAVAAAEQRLQKYHTSPVVPLDVLPTNENPHPIPDDQLPSKYNFCPDNYDVLDPAVLRDPATHPVPVDDPNGILAGSKMLMPPDSVPDHAHWVVLDQTQIPGDWEPRRPDWFSVLVSGQPTPIDPNLSTGSGNQQSAVDAQKAEKALIDMLQSVTLSDNVKQLANTEIPMGLWKVDKSCDFSSVRTVASYASSLTSTVQYPAAWMQSLVDSKQLSGSEPVYSQLPGEAIHNMVCTNCHGAKADSSGRQALTLNEMTGGHANVTDLRNGIMSPDNRQRVFSSAPLDGANVDDWASRYFVWMALGGTKQTIPGSILAVIASTRVLDAARPLAAAPIDANMLSSAKDLCSSVLPMSITTGQTQPLVLSSRNRFNFEGGMFEKDTPSKAPQTTLIYSNGDAMLWGQVCSVDNPPPVRALTVLKPDTWATTSSPQFVVRASNDFYDSTVYPTGASVVDQRGNVVSGIKANNYFPWCIRPPADPSVVGNANNPLLIAANAWIDANRAPDGNKLPYCPNVDSHGAGYITTSFQGDPSLSVDVLNQWINRGAVNAGMMVFLYLNQITNGDLAPTPPFDQCSQLLP